MPNKEHEDFEREVRELRGMKERLDQIEIPGNIDQYIRAGMSQGQVRRTRFRTARFASMAASLLLAAFLLSVRVSPTFAAYVGQIPVLDSIVKLVNYDKGLQLALENEFIQPVGVSDEHDGIKVTVDGIIVDETRMLIFYTIENKGDYGRINISRFNFNDEESWIRGLSYGSPDFDEKRKTQQGKVDVSFNERANIPEKINVSFQLAALNKRNASDPPSARVGDEHPTPYGDSFDTTWDIPISIDKAKFEGLKEVYEINQTVRVQGQSITFKSLTVHPTRAALEVEYDPNNSKKIFRYDDIRLVDENGEDFGTITSGIGGRGNGENGEILYFQSNYFKKPKQLYIQANEYSALDKDQLEVLVDLKEEKLLKRPDDRLTLDKIQYGSDIVLHFTLSRFYENEHDRNRSFGLFSNIYKDASGEKYHSNMSGSSTIDSEGINTIQYHIKKENYTNPITLTLYEYPSRISGPINIQVK
jgi:hypothetical protein